jgi:hypothetical protein
MWVEAGRMTDQTDTRDRVIKLERDLEHLTRTVDEMAIHVKEMRDLFLQAKGARWFIITAASVGGFIAAKIGAFIPWLSITPR